MPTYPPPSLLAKNELNPKTGIKIIELGCKFIFDDGTNDDKVKSTNIAAGGQDELFSTHTDCCRAYFPVLIKAQYPDGSTETIIDNATVEPDYCGGQLIFHLVPAARISKTWQGKNPPLEIVRGR